MQISLKLSRGQKHSKFTLHTKFTERDELQYVEYLKRKALPLTAHTDRTFGLILGRGIHRVNMNGATIQWVACHWCKSFTYVKHLHM